MRILSEGRATFSRSMAKTGEFGKKFKLCNVSRKTIRQRPANYLKNFENIYDDATMADGDKGIVKSKY